MSLLNSSSDGNQDESIVLYVEISDYEELECPKSLSVVCHKNATALEVIRAIARKGSVQVDLSTPEKEQIFQLYHVPNISGPDALNSPSKKMHPILLDKPKPISMQYVKNKDRVILKKGYLSNQGSSGNLLSGILGITGIHIAHIELDLSKSITSLRVDPNGKLQFMTGINHPGTDVAVVSEIPFRFDSSSDKVTKLVLANTVPHMRIQVFPDGFFDCQKLSSLRTVHLQNIGLTQIPDDLCNLQTVQSLHFEDNKLTHLNPNMSKLFKLQKLYLQRNKLEELPEDIWSSFISLKILVLDENDLKQLPLRLGANSPHLKVVSVANNPLITPPTFICEKGTLAILKYLSNMQHALRNIPPQRFPFRYKISFSTGKTDIQRDANRRTLLPQDMSGAQPVNSHKAAFIISRQDSIFLNNKHNMFFFIESGSHASGFSVAPVIVQPFQLKSMNQVMDCQLAYFSIFESIAGNRAAEYCKNSLHVNLIELANHMGNKALDFSQIFTAAVKQTDDEFLQIARFEHITNAGAYVLSLMFVDNELICTNLGHCRAIICRGSEPHRITKENRKEQMQKQRSATILKKDATSPECQIHGKVTKRAVGLLELKDSSADENRVVCTNVPEFFSEILTPRDQYIIIATSGIFSVLSERNVVDIAMNATSCSEAAKTIVDTALQKGLKSGELSASCVVLKLCWHIEAAEDDSALKRNSVPDEPRKSFNISRTSSDQQFTVKSESNSNYSKAEPIIAQEIPEIEAQLAADSTVIAQNTGEDRTPAPETRKWTIAKRQDGTNTPKQVFLNLIWCWD
mmetsp:Transcript_30363/g.42630  ORF Transcript_30363/g.42630 Transcript_30363/m.42630 type:complete len:800 (+) Transcript_30363:133-2532(+)